MEVVWRFEQRAFYIGSWRVKLILAPHTPLANVMKCKHIHTQSDWYRIDTDLRNKYDVKQRSTMCMRDASSLIIYMQYTGVKQV
jgi:hypothetical protein